MAWLVAQVLWLAAPATIACALHMVIVKRGWLVRLDVPLDGGRTLLGRSIFGRNKTWRGVLVVVVGTTLLGGAQGAMLGEAAAAAGWACVRYPSWEQVQARLSFLAGYGVVNAAVGTAYVLGELPNSFLKRRLSIDPGARGRGPWRALFFVLDQTDGALLGFAVCAAVFSFSWTGYGIAVLTVAALHATVTFLLHRSGVKRAM